MKVKLLFARAKLLFAGNMAAVRPFAIAPGQYSGVCL